MAACLFSRCLGNTAAFAGSVFIYHLIVLHVKMSKRQTLSSENFGNKKQQLSISIKQKVELLMIQNPENPEIRKALIPRLSR
jgi:hypothetical protein